MQNNSYTTSFSTTKTPDEIFELLLQIEQWWTGLFDESVTGKSQEINDEFSFKAGAGAHYSKHKLVALVPCQEISWLVTESSLNFLTNKTEWTGTKIRFNISTLASQTQVTFTHEGLTPEIECFNACSGAWNKYIEKLQHKLNQ